jgi:hypothetical protein
VDTGGSVGLRITSVLLGSPPFEGGCTSPLQADKTQIQATTTIQTFFIFHPSPKVFISQNSFRHSHIGSASTIKIIKKMKSCTFKSQKCRYNSRNKVSGKYFDRAARLTMPDRYPFNTLGNAIIYPNKETKR